MRISLSGQIMVNLLYFSPVGVKLGTSFSLLWCVSQIHSSLSSKLKGTYSLNHPSLSQIVTVCSLCTKHFRRWGCAGPGVLKRLFSSCTDRIQLDASRACGVFCSGSGPGVTGIPDTPWKVHCSCRSDWDTCFHIQYPSSTQPAAFLLSERDFHLETALLLGFSS